MNARTSRARVMSIALLTLMALAGFLVGVAWQERKDGIREPSEERGGERRAERGSRRLVIDEVGLEPEQRAHVDEIIRHFRIQMRALDDEFRESYRPRQRALFQSSLDSIRSVLDSAQWAAYDSLRAIRYRRGDGVDDSVSRGPGSDESRR